LPAIAPPGLKDGAGFTEGQAADTAGPSSLGNNAAVTGLGEKASRRVSGRRAHGLWPGVGRLWATNVTATEHGTRAAPRGKSYHQRSRGADSA
jgi:hypothetical protein